VTRSSIRHAVFKHAPAGRDTLVEAVAEEVDADTVVINDTLDYLERRGEVYTVEDEVRETGADHG